MNDLPPIVFDWNDKNDMLRILAGPIQFFPGWKIDEKRAVKAPDLRMGNVSYALSKHLNDIIDNVVSDTNVKQEVKDMVPKVKNLCNSNAADWHV